MKKKWLIAAVCALILVLTACSGRGQGGASQLPGETTNAPTETEEPAAKPWETNVLRSDEVSTPGEQDSQYGSLIKHAVLGSDYQRRQIKTVTFLDKLEDMPEDSWDVSEYADGSVMAWVEPNGELYDLYIGADGGISTGVSCRELFAGYDNMEQITFAGVLHTEDATDMSRMFSWCSSLQHLDISSFNTGNVQDMSKMFEVCLLLRHIDLSSFNTAAVRDMQWMFWGCSQVESLDLSGFDTSKVQSMWNMFDGCKSLTSLNLSSFDTANVQDMWGMFAQCEKLTDLKLGDSFVTINANTSDMFYNCPAGDDYQHLVN